MKILLDGMGGDNAPKAVVEGAVMAAREFEHEIILIGDEERLEKALKEASGHKRPANISICHASEVITNNEAPALAIRRKKDSSIVVGMNMLKRGEGDLFISAGSTGALGRRSPDHRTDQGHRPTRHLHHISDTRQRGIAPLRRRRER